MGFDNLIPNLRQGASRLHPIWQAARNAKRRIAVWSTATRRAASSVAWMMVIFKAGRADKDGLACGRQRCTQIAE
ncbi:MAG: hypothetical protein IPN48_05120 [Sphingomonadales bacterium]|nr:hypothetical protein [Sphingomonadales bacterium]